MPRVRGPIDCVWPRHRDGERRRTWYEQRFLPTLDALTRLDVERVLEQVVAVLISSSSDAYCCAGSSG